MNDERPPDQAELGPVTDQATRRMLGMFDAPAFARRGIDLDRAVEGLHARCRRNRLALLDMVRLRLKQCASAATGVDAHGSVFLHPIQDLWTLTEMEPPVWAASPAPARRLEDAGRHLLASIVRFNRRWHRFVHKLDLEPINKLISHYNRYYLLEKECSLGSSRLAARFFRPISPVTVTDILETHPFLPVPFLIGRRQPPR